MAVSAFLMGFFMTSLAVTLYYKERIYNEISSQGGQNSTTAASLDSEDLEKTKLVLDILPGLEVAVLNDTEGLISQLYKWIAAKQVRTELADD